MGKSEILKTINIGSRVAELEIEGLKQYFLKTYLWEEVMTNQIDAVFGCKGSGKSAIYSYLTSLEYELINEGVLLALAENPKGAVAFKDLSTTPPADEFEFKSIWKLYFSILVYQKLIDFDYTDVYLNEVGEILQECDLIPRTFSFSSLVKLVRNYINRTILSIEPSAGINEHSGLIDKVSLKISFSEPSINQVDKGVKSVDQIFELLNKSLINKEFKVWIAIDRLDAVFQDNFELEAKALRTLFQVYIDMMAFSNIRLIIFMRDDIWNRIIEGGFRETSHITKTDTIVWDKKSLCQLLMSRLDQNKELLKYTDIPDCSTLVNQQKLFKLFFPLKNAENTEFNFDWIINRIKDSNGNSMPRELIHLVSAAIKHQIKINDISENSGSSLVSIEAMNEGYKEASKTKFDTLVAEYPMLKFYMYRLKGKKVRLKLDELKEYWDISQKKVKIIANNLTKLGFFKIENENEADKDLIYFVPLIYRHPLLMK